MILPQTLLVYIRLQLFLLNAGPMSVMESEAIAFGYQPKAVWLVTPNRATKSHILGSSLRS